MWKRLLMVLLSIQYYYRYYRCGNQDLERLSNMMLLKQEREVRFV